MRTLWIIIATAAVVFFAGPPARAASESCKKVAAKPSDQLTQVDVDQLVGASMTAQCEQI